MVAREQLQRDQRRAAGSGALVVETAVEQLDLLAPAELADRPEGDGAIAEVCVAGGVLDLLVPDTAEVGEGTLIALLGEGVGLGCGFRESGHWGQRYRITRASAGTRGRPASVRVESAVARNRQLPEARARRPSPAPSSDRPMEDVQHMRAKVTVVGAGNVGATCALEVARGDYADVVLVDIVKNFPQGKALDMNQAAAVLGYQSTITGTNGYDETEGSEVVVITAGVPRKPGMSRDDLVTTNENIVASVTKEIVKRSPKAIVIVVSNPLDAMCHVARAVSKLPKERVFGMAGILDTARFSAFIAFETGMSIQDVQAMVLGGHGDQMVPVVSATTVGGIPLQQLVPQKKIDAMVERTRKGGGELVNLLGTSAWYAPGVAAAQMVESIVLDKKRVLPCTAYLEGEYGVKNLYMGVPVVLGKGGIEKIVKLTLSAEEKKMMKISSAAVADVVKVLKAK